MNNESWIYLTNLSLLFGLTNLSLLLGWLSIYVALPKRGSIGSSNFLCYGFGFISLLIAGAQVFREYSFNPELVLFCIFSFFSIVGATLLVVSKNPARGALAFALTISSTGGIFLLLAAPFVMAANIIVYAGAIVVTFLFLLMLVKQHHADLADTECREPFLASLAGFALMATIVSILTAAFPSNSLTVNRGEVERVLSETKVALDISNLSELKVKVINGDSYVVSRLKNAFGGSGYWVERIEVEVQKNGTVLLNKSENIDEIKSALNLMLDIGTEYLKNKALLRPEGPVASNAGADPSLPLAKIRKDKTGRPAMPADNTSFLGKLLFSDQLLAVELVGLLLLVATIGAIVIVRKLPTKVSL